MIGKNTKAILTPILVDDEKLRKLQKEFLRGRKSKNEPTRRSSSERPTLLTSKSTNQFPKPREILKDYIKKRLEENKDCNAYNTAVTLKHWPPLTPTAGQFPIHRRVFSDQIQTIFRDSLKKDDETSPKITPDSTPKTFYLEKDPFLDLNSAPRKRFKPQPGENALLIQHISNYFKTYLDGPPTTTDFYSIGETIGKGPFGIVFIGKHKLAGINVAIKSIAKVALENEDARKKVLHEVLILKKTRHERINRILEVFASEHHYFIVMEYAGGGDLLQFVKKKKKIVEKEAKDIFRQILEGAQLMHSNRVLHRDIKLENILLDSSYSSIKFCDFSSSRVMRRGDVATEKCGTPAYLAPEMIAGKGYEEFSVDIWCLGILLYTMLCGTVPFKGKNIKELQIAILKGTIDYPDFLSEEAKDLISQFLDLIPQNRISIWKALEHPWFSSEGKDENNIAPFFVGGPLERRPRAFDDAAISEVSKFGYPKSYLINSLRNGDLNHATASYYLLRENMLVN
ncbi:unnamed protein product [Blepharisma stoltei]|uniref:Protein kinase domain-containing protein n=1 Tax=Blepharisma stoltei TaxID=1481888 RepID=A0AAU9JZB4_9CILI|nr:unnamed protein product [Blepharisma stoltei]